MKRCLICGNTDDDSSTVCSVCGNRYTEASEDIPEGMKDLSEPDLSEQSAPEETAEEPKKEPVQTQAQQECPGAQAGGADRTSRTAAGNRPPRRTRSGPQIYGQQELTQGGSEMYADQGTIRRTVQGRPPENRLSGERLSESRPQRAARPANQAADSRQGRPARPASGEPRRQAPSGQRRQGRPAAGQERPAAADFRSRRVMEASRSALRSPLFLLAALLFTVYLISSILAIFMKELNYSQLVRLIGDTGMPGQISGYFHMAASLLRALDSGDVILADFAICIPDLLFCIGLWMIVVNARTAREKMSGSGFALTRAVVILRMVCACLIMLVVLILSVAVMIAAWVSGERPMILMAAAILVITVVIIMMVIMYYFCFLATLKTCRQNSNMGESYGKASAYVAALHIILSLLSIVTLLSGIVNAEITGITGAIGKMGWMILFGIWILGYRRKLARAGE